MFPRRGGHAWGASRPRSPIWAGPGACGWLPGRGNRAVLTSRKITIDDTISWIIGTGEWGEAEEAYLNEVLHRWKTRKEMNLRTATQWAKHAGVWVHAYKQRRPEEAKRERVPSGSECEEWCKKLEEAFGVSLEFRKIADLVKPLKAKNLRQFR
uniref:Uncharacterized protein n=1 Tax=Schizophyllum commune (strain H4-8 / FGSC 9210) TaxID=578458 RepID=D8PWB1_SCHCM